VPIFEYLCPACNRIFSFLSLRPQPAGVPVCPHCAATNLTRVPSSFAVARKSADVSRSAPAPGGADGPGAGHPTGDDDPAAARMEAEMMRMADSLGDADAENPRVMARMMRRMAEVSGEPVTDTMNEMLRRLEAGEDPETLEEELGGQLEAEMGGADGAGGAPTRDDGLYDM